MNVVEVTTALGTLAAVCAECDLPATHAWVTLDRTFADDSTLEASKVSTEHVDIYYFCDLHENYGPSSADSHLPDFALFQALEKYRSAS